MAQMQMMAAYFGGVPAISTMVDMIMTVIVILIVTGTLMIKDMIRDEVEIEAATVTKIMWR